MMYISSQGKFVVFCPTLFMNGLWKRRLHDRGHLSVRPLLHIKHFRTGCIWTCWLPPKHQIFELGELANDWLQGCYAVRRGMGFDFSHFQVWISMKKRRERTVSRLFCFLKYITQNFVLMLSKAGWHATECMPLFGHKKTKLVWEKKCSNIFLLQRDHKDHK